MTIKAALVVLWACAFAGAAVSSENHRLCPMHSHEQAPQSQQDQDSSEKASEKILIARYDVTN